MTVESYAIGLVQSMAYHSVHRICRHCDSIGFDALHSTALSRKVSPDYSQSKSTKILSHYKSKTKTR